MIQFLGLHLDQRRASAVCLGRDIAIWATSETPMVNATEDTATGSVEVPPAEWVRAGCYALQETFFDLPARERKIWGVGLSAPSGWIALDFNYRPLSPLRLVRGSAALSDLGRWQEENPRAADRIATVLAPKDYFRFAISGGLATDVTEVDRIRCLRPGANEWSESALERIGVGRNQLPPVFDSHTPTGRLSESGIHRTSLPGGTWIVAGAHEDAAAVVTAADVRTATLWLIERSGGAPIAVLGVAGLEAREVPPAWNLARSAIAGYRLLEKVLPAVSAEILTQPETTDPLVASLTESGYGIDEVVLTSSNPAVGAAALAAVGSGLVKDWDRYYRAVDEQTAEGEEEEGEGKMTNDQ